jgi:hypothetical protein
MTDDFYERLGVSRDATREDIERAYRRRAKECHPDTSDHPDARERFVRLTRARDVLTDPTERASYDRLGHAAYVGAEPDDPVARPADGRPPSRRRTDRETDTRERQRESRARRTSSRADPTEPRGERTTDRTATGEDNATVTRFAPREGAAALVLLGLGAAIVGGASTLAFPPLVGAALVGGLWVVVSVVAATLAARFTGVLPDEVVRAHAVPLTVLVLAFYVYLYLDVPVLLPAVLMGYGVFTALFRTTTLVATGRGRVAPALCWFVGSAPVAIVVFGAENGLTAALVGTAVTRLPAALAEPAVAMSVIAQAVVVGVALPLTVSLAHASWRLGGVLVE